MMISLLAMTWLLCHSACATTCTLNIGNCSATGEDSFNLTCTEINSWSEVNNEFSSIKCRNPPNSIYLKPSGSLILSNELNITTIAFAFPVDKSTVNLISAYGLNGIEVYPWPACQSCVKSYLKISFSVIEFYVSNQPPGSYNCTPDLVPDDSATSVSFLSQYTSSILIDYGNSYGSLSHAVCPFLFKNAHISYDFTLFSQVDSIYLSACFDFKQTAVLRIKQRRSQSTRTSFLFLLPIVSTLF
jgi:hypothetical protein